MSTSDPQDRQSIKPIDLMGLGELAEHLARYHAIVLPSPDRYLPGHRRNHAERLHSQAHNGQVDNHSHPYEPPPPEVPTS